MRTGKTGSMPVGHYGLFLTAVNGTVTLKTHPKWSILTWEAFKKSLRHSESMRPEDEFKHTHIVIQVFFLLLWLADPREEPEARLCHGPDTDSKVQSHKRWPAATHKEQSHFCCFEIEPLSLLEEVFARNTGKNKQRKNKQTRRLTVVPAYSCVLATANSWKRNTCFAIVAAALLQRAVCLVLLTVDAHVKRWAVWNKNSSSTPLPAGMINYSLGSIHWM